MAIREIDWHHNNRLEQQKAKILEDAEALSLTCENFLKDRVCNSVAQNIIQRISELLKIVFAAEEGFQSRISSARYIFEALIQSALLSKEPEYGHKIYFGAVSNAEKNTKCILIKLKRSKVFWKII